MAPALAAERARERVAAVGRVVGVDFGGAGRVAQPGGRDHDVGGEGGARVCFAGEAVADCELF